MITPGNITGPPGAAPGGWRTPPRAGIPLHGLLAWEHAAIIELSGAWGEVDRSHRKLAHRGSRIGLVHVSESTVRRVPGEEGLVLEGPPPREPLPRAPWPDWLEWKPNQVFTHWTRARRTSIAILDVVSRKWLATLTSAEETSTRAEACFLAALGAENLLEAADQLATAALREAIASGETSKVQAIADQLARQLNPDCSSSIPVRVLCPVYPGWGSVGIRAAADLGPRPKAVGSV